MKSSTGKLLASSNFLMGTLQWVCSVLLIWVVSILLQLNSSILRANKDELKYYFVLAI